MRQGGTDGIAGDREAAGWIPRWGLLAWTTSFLVLALGVNFLLVVAMLDKPYSRVLLTPILPLAAELKAELEAPSPLGGEPHSAALLERWRERFREQLTAGGLVLTGDESLRPEEVEVSLTSWVGRILASTDPGSIGGTVPRQLLLGGAAAGTARAGGGGVAPVEAGRPRVVRLGGDSYVVCLYQVAEGKFRRLLIKLPGAALRLSASGLFAAHYGIGLAILAVGAGALGLGLRMAGSLGRDQGGSAARRTSLLVMGVALVCQFATNGLLLGGLARDSLTSAKASTELLLGQVARRAEGAAPDAAGLAGGSSAGRVLGDLLAGIPELAGATIQVPAGPGGLPVEVASPERAPEGEWMARAARGLVWLLGMEGQLSVQVPYRAPGAAAGPLVATLPPALALKRVLASTFDSVTVLLIAILFSAELLVILRHYIGTPGSAAAERPGTDYVLVRPVAFLYVFGIDLSMSFLPLHMERLYRPLFGLSKDVVTGLPISAEFLCVGVAILAAGVWYDRRGWREPLFVGLSLATVGGLCSWLASEAVTFIVSRALVGTGYGLALMASQGFVIGNTDGRTKAQGLAYLFAGLYAGSICGGATGGILAERYGYRATFFLGAVTIALVIPCAIVLLRHARAHPPSEEARGRTPAVGVRRLGLFLCDRSVLALMLLSSLPASIAVVGFLNYFSPLHLQRLGVSEATIAQLLVIYGVCLIYCGPLMGRYADAAESRRAFVFVGCLLGAAAFLAFNALEGVLAMAVTILLMGLSHSLVLSSQSAYLLDLKVTRELGQGMALGIFRASSRMGQMIGPIVFSFVTMSGSIRTSVGWLGGVYLVLAVLFLLLTHQRRKVWQRGLPRLRLAGRHDRPAGEPELDKPRGK